MKSCSKFWIYKLQQHNYIWQTHDSYRHSTYRVSQKSDSQIQITTNLLIRINYNYNHFNYHLIGVSVANFDKICSMVSEIKVIKNWYQKKKQKFPIWNRQIHNNVFVLLKVTFLRVPGASSWLKTNSTMALMFSLLPLPYLLSAQPTVLISLEQSVQCWTQPLLLG